MTPESAIAMLDRQLAAHGEDVVLQRVTGTTNQAVFSANCRARLLQPSPTTPLAAGLVQDNLRYILSPTDIDAAQWPGPAVLPAPSGDRRIPRKGDRLIVQGIARTIQNATARIIDGTVVGVEIDFTG